MSVKVTKNKIAITRGDTLRTTISITDSDGNEYTPEEGDVIRFALKKNYTDDVPIIEKVIPNGTLELRLDSSDTKLLEQEGVYLYDIELSKADGTVDTFISSTLTTHYEVTD